MAEVTRADREAAFRLMGVQGEIPSHQYNETFLDTGADPSTIYPITRRVAAALAASSAEVTRLEACLETMATFQDQRAVTARRLGAFNVANACSQFADRIRSGMPVACIVGDGVEQVLVYEDEPGSGEFILYGSPELLQRAAESERAPTAASPNPETP